LPSHVPIPLYRPWVVDAVSPVPFLSPPSDLTAPVPGEMPAKQRRKLWELAIHEEAVKAAGHHDIAGRLLHKALDRRHEATIKRFHKAQDIEAVRLLWEGRRCTAVIFQGPIGPS
jgi:hypothetical protein